MCAEGIEFSEGEEYSFVQCVDSKGDIYGVQPGEQCKSGKQISDDQAKKLRSKKKEKEDESSARMAKLKAAFRKKTGREMNEEEKAKAAWIANGKKK